MWLRTHILLCILVLGVFTSFAQETKDDIEKEGENHFRKEEFLNATPYYLRLLSLEPRNPNYNYKYGTCLLFNSSEKKKAFRYLNFAVSKSNEVDDEAYYYLGKAYHLTYQFDKAIKNYQRYKSVAGNNALEKLQVDRQIQMCKNGKTLLANISETIVLNKQEIGIEDFFRIYDLSNIGGELIVTEEFQSREDKKNNHTPLIHFPVNSDKIFYSTYSNNGNQKDIFMRTRLSDGSWSLQQPVFGEVNTNFDEDYPYMHPNGKYLYFSSKGHNSMGGYDIFRSQYDKETNKFGAPENLDIAISSPDNDFLYIVDSLNKYAYFASQRESEMDKVNVYHVRVERFPIQVVIISGQFSSTLNPNEKDLSIVINDASGVEVGSYETNESGGYLIVLPRGGKYEFVLNVDGKEATYKHWIELPYLKELRPLKQKITETEQNGSEIILIENLFDEEFDDPMAILAEAVAEKSKMNVNKDYFDLDSLDRLREQRKLPARVALENFRNYEIKDLVESKFNDLNTRLNTSEEKMAKAKKTIQNRSESIKNALKKSDSLMELVNNTTNEEDKKRYIRLANQDLQKIKYTEEKVKNAIVWLEFLENDIEKTEELVGRSKSLKEDIDKIDTDDDQALIDVLSKHKSFVENELKKMTAIGAQFEYLSRIDEELKNLEEHDIREKQLEQQKIDAQKEIERLKKEFANAKRKDKEALEMELNAKENQISDINNEIDYTDKLIEKGKDLRSQKQIVEEINNTTIDENESYSSTDELKNKFSDQSSSIQTKTQENKKAVAENNVDIADESNKTDESNNIHSNDVTEDSESEKQTILDEVDNNYAEEITQIEEDYNNDDASIDEVIDRKTQHQEALEKALQKVQEDISENGSTPENSKRQKVIEEEIASTDRQIAELEQTKAATAGTTDVTEASESEKQAILDDVDNNYAEEIAQIEDDYKNDDASIGEVIDRKTQHQETLEKALQNVQEDISENGTTSENSKRKNVIEKEIASTDRQIAELEQTKAATAGTNDVTEVSESEKQAVLEEVDKSYRFEIGDFSEDFMKNKVDKEKVIKRKQKYIDNIDKALKNVEEAISAEENIEDNTKRKDVLNEEKRRVSIEIDELEQANEISNETISENKSKAIQETDLNQKESEALNSNDDNLETLKLKEKALNKVEKTLENSKKNTSSIVEKRDINSTLENVKKEKRQVQIEIGDLSQDQKEDIIADNNQKVTNSLDDKQKYDIKKSKDKIDEYSSEKEELEKSIAKSDSPEEAETTQKKLDKIEEKIAKEETKILEETTETGNDVAEEEVNKLQLDEKTSLPVIDAEKDLLESQELMTRAENTKDPIKKAELLKEAQEKQNNAIEKNEKEQAQRKAKILIGDITSNKELNTIDPENVSETTADIEKEQVQIGIRLMEIDDQLNQIDALMTSLKNKEAEELKEQKDDLFIIQEKLEDKQSENKQRLTQIAEEKKETDNKGIDEASINNELTYKKEIEIAQTEEYKEISRAINTLEQKQYELKVKEEKLVEEKTNLKDQLEVIESKENPSQQEQEKITETLTEIDNTNHEIEIFKNEIREQQENINIRIPNDPEKREQIENMVARNVDPIIEAPTLPTMSTGLVLLDENRKTYTDENPIPLSIEKPEGLVFRVQIGAFSKPVPNETFNDFSPVTGEEVRPGLIRYMAGYFGGRGDATEARNQIRTMGYSDAFVVAYCDGERIPVYRAEQLLASGACVPTIEISGKPILTADEATDQNGGTTFKKELDEFAYNKAPGAAEADVAESKMGLYYTVQVGVYNKPVSAEQLKNILPLITKRLPNGQMRYSSGVFDNLDNAREKKSEAIERGITDAFIVAYFKGERITVSQAQKLVEENGQEIFESKNPTVVKRNKVENKPNTPDPEPEKYFKNKLVQTQFISKTAFDSYPTQVMQRYNSSGMLFYYDTISRKIMSLLYDQNSMPDLNGFENDFVEKNYFNGYEIKNIDATNQEEAINNNDTVNQLTATVLSSDLNDDLIQVILNSPLLKKAQTTERGLKAVFYEVNSEEGINNLQIKLARFGATRLKKSVVSIKQSN
jgi:hypothetical protein